MSAGVTLRACALQALLLAVLVVLLVGSAQAAPGALDSSFGSGGKVVTDFGPGDDGLDGVALQTDGKIVAAGWVQSGGSNYDFALARYKPGGSLDGGFGSGGKVTTAFGSGSDWIGAVAIQRDGKIVTVGRATSGTQSQFGLARYKANGSLDSSFGSGGKVMTAIGPGSTAVGVAVRPDGKIVAAGYTYGGPNSSFAVARYTARGSLDTSFGTGGIVTTSFSSSLSSYASAVALQPDGKIVVAGESYVGSYANSDFALARYNPNGSPDTTFGTGGMVTTAVGESWDYLYALALQCDGRILLGGQVAIDGGATYDAALVRYKPDGSLDTSFGSGGKIITAVPRSFGALTVQLNRKIVAAGTIKDSGAERRRFALARYNPDGSLDTSFGSGGNVATALGPHEDYVTGIALQPDGKIVAGGGSDKTMTYSDYRFALARYQGDTCVVPKLKGRKLAGAKRLIKRKKCAVGKVKRRFSSRWQKGRVISQRPPAGKRVAAAWKVNLVASRGPHR